MKREMEGSPPTMGCRQWPSSDFPASVSGGGEKREKKKKVRKKKNEMKRNAKCEFLLLKFTLDLLEFG